MTQALTADDIEALFRAHNSRLVHYAATVIRGDRYAAEDAAAEAWATAWSERDEVSGLRSPLAWLTTLTRFAALAEVRDHRGQAGRRKVELASGRTIGLYLKDLPDDEDNTTGLPGLADPETIAKWAEVVQWLPPAQAEAIWLITWGGYTYAEAAQEAGVDIGSIRAAVCTGLARIRHYFADRQGFPRGCSRCGWPIRSVGHNNACRPKTAQTRRAALDNRTSTFG